MSSEEKGPPLLPLHFQQSDDPVADLMAEAVAETPIRANSVGEETFRGGGRGRAWGPRQIMDQKVVPAMR